jgi:hypothetical protein
MAACFSALYTAGVKANQNPRKYAEKYNSPASNNFL